MKILPKYDNAHPNQCVGVVDPPLATFSSRQFIPFSADTPFVSFLDWQLCIRKNKEIENINYAVYWQNEGNQYRHQCKVCAPEMVLYFSRV